MHSDILFWRVFGSLIIDFCVTTEHTSNTINVGCHGCFALNHVTIEWEANNVAFKRKLLKDIILKIL